jgi:hypothetical protein
MSLGTVAPATRPPRAAAARSRGFVCLLRTQK